jgi:transcriptional regulator with GAF, ATPase, and Fis domain
MTSSPGPFRLRPCGLPWNEPSTTRRLLCDALLIPGVPASQVPSLRFVGSSQPMQEVFKRIGLVARRDESVLILGETGTGKEMVARTIHRHSERSDHPFLAINCAAIPENLLESELFGHEKGAFTGASQRRLGAFECAHGGTLFLDEIGDMSLPLQAKILRVLQQGEIHRVGGNETIAVDVRVLTATNKVLEKAIQTGAFREDLYYRLNVVSIRLPPLREHREDILELVEYFLERYTHAGGPRPALDAAALRKLQKHHWPGNIRELENTIRRALVTAKGHAIMEQDIVLGEPTSCAGKSDVAACAHCQLGQTAHDSNFETASDSVLVRASEEQLDSALRQWLVYQIRQSPADGGQDIPARLEDKLLDAAMDFTHGNQVKASRLLGISRTTLRQWLSRRTSR